MGGPPDVPDFEAIARRYRLLPYERWAAKRYLNRRHPPVLFRFPVPVDDSPDARVLLGVFRGWGIPGYLLGLCGLGLLFVSGGAAYAYWTCYLGIAVIAGAVVRGLSLNAKARRFATERGTRPPPPPPV